MAIHDRSYLRSQSSVGQINTFATQVYGWMTIGLCVTAFVAWFIFKSGLFAAILPYCWLTGLGTLGIAFLISARINTISFTGMASLFVLYSTLQGVFFGSTLPVFAASFGGQIIWTAFGTAALIFAIAVAYGVFSKSDMTSLGRILSIGVMGLVAVTLLYMILSFFMPMTGMMLLISYFGLIIFVGLTAYDANQIKKMSSQVDGYSVMSCKLSLVMALRMYINVIMVFWYLIQIFSATSRR